MVRVMQFGKQSDASRGSKNISALTGISIIAVCAGIAGAYTLTSSEKLSLQLSQQFSQEFSASVLPPLNNTPNDRCSQNASPDKIWDTLKENSLQGEHYTLKIVGKKPSSDIGDCSSLSTTATDTYSDTVFVPNDGVSSQNNKITRTYEANEEIRTNSEKVKFGVRDACTAPLDGSVAEISVPKNKKGYYVITRALGKPTSNPELTINGKLLFIKDEFGSDFLVLGYVSDGGFQTPVQVYAQSNVHSVATDISSLFEWSGKVCYVDSTNYCSNSQGTEACSNEELCCSDTNADSLPDSCIEASHNFDGTRACTSGSLTALSCRIYVHEWIFNIDEFTQYLWSSDTDGNFEEAEILFYPVQ